MFPSSQSATDALIRSIRDADEEERIDLAPPQFILMLHVSTCTEPSRFGELYDALETLVARNARSFDASRTKVIQNLAEWVVCADYGVCDENDLPDTMPRLLANAQCYGPAMKAFAAHIGVSGMPLSEYVLRSHPSH